MAQRGRHSAAHADGGSGSSGAASGASRGGGGGGGVPADRAAGGSGGDGGSGGGGSLRGGGGGGCFPPGGAPAQIRTRPGMPCGTCDGEVWQPTCIEGLAPGVKGNQCGQGGSAGAAAGSLLCGTHERSSPAGPSSAGDTGSAPAQISQQTRPVRSVLGGSRSGNEVGRGGSSSMGSRGFAQQEDDPGGGGGFMPEDLPTRSSFLPELPGSGCSGDLVPTETPGSAFDSGRAAGGGFMPEDLPARGGSRDGNGGLVVLDDMPNSNLSGGSSSGFVPEGLPGGGSGVDGSKYGGGFVPEESPGSGAGAGGADGGGFMPAGLPGGGGACGGTSDGLGGGGFLSGCEQCGCPSISSVWWSTFGARLCDGCARSAPLISKGSAKAAYLLTDRDLRGLGAMPKTNPQHKAWKPMLLYLQSQVRARREWGGRANKGKRGKGALQMKRNLKVTDTRRLAI
eukprot:353118-Chlamydomonas_euryale.AAC.3